MTLALLVAVATFIFWLLLLFVRWARVLPVTRRISGEATFVALGFSGATMGGVYPIVWAISSNLKVWGDTGRTMFTFAGHLPPGVDEDDLLIAVVVGLTILLSQAAAEVRAYIVRREPAADRE